MGTYTTSLRLAVPAFQNAAINIPDPPNASDGAYKNDSGAYVKALGEWAQRTKGNIFTQSAGTDTGFESDVATDFALLEDAITGIATIGIGGLTTYTLKVASGEDDEARNAAYRFVGALGANCTVLMPSVPKLVWVTNYTTGGHLVTLTTGSGRTFSVPNYQFGIPPWFLVICDGTNVDRVPFYGEADYLALSDFGADPTGATDSTVAFLAFGAACMATGRRGHIPTGNFALTGPLTLDLGPVYGTGLHIQGNGGMHSNLNITNATTSPALTIIASTQYSFYSTFQGFSINSSCASPTLSLGRNLGNPAAGKPNYPDEHNDMTMVDMHVNNGSMSPNATGISVNGVYNCDFFFVVNTGGYGEALRINNSAFSTYKGSWSSGEIGLRISEFYVFGNVFIAHDIEVVNLCVAIDSPSASCNTWIGGTNVYQNGTGPARGGIWASAGNNNRFIGTNCPGPVEIMPGSIGVQVDHLGYPQILVKNDVNDAAVVLNTPAGHANWTIYQRSNLNRWQVGQDSATETGGNAGSDWRLISFDDTGNYLATPMIISRTSSDVTIHRLQAEQIGFFGGALTGVRPVVSGSRAGNVALGSLMSILGGMGFVTDSTTAGSATDFAAAINIATTTADASVVLNAAAGFGHWIIVQHAGSARWLIGADNSTETGANAGTNFAIWRYSDAGAGIDAPVSISRANGVTSIGKLAAAGVNFFGGTVITTRPTVTGAKAGNAALTSLLTQLASLGLITDSST